MKLNGALEPQKIAPVRGKSFGVSIAEVQRYKKQFKITKLYKDKNCSPHSSEIQDKNNISNLLFIMHESQYQTERAYFVFNCSKQEASNRKHLIPIRRYANYWKWLLEDVIIQICFPIISLYYVLLQNPVNHIINFVKQVSHPKSQITLAWQRLKHKCTLLASSIDDPKAWTSLYVTLICLYTLPASVIANENDFFAINAFSSSPETTTIEFDYASRGQKKFGDKCENTLECGFPGSICDPKKKSCQCTDDLPITNHIDKCGKEAAVNQSCFFNEQCETKYFQTECKDGRCVCRFEMAPIWLKDGTVECKGRQDTKIPETYIDPAMIGVLIGMALMFIIICVVLRLFSQARWHNDNRTIFNTPNPRLMNVSLLRESKHGQERRGSRISMRPPSRQPSLASLRTRSPIASTGKGDSRSNSNASASSLQSNRSNSVVPSILINREETQFIQPQQQHQQLITNITANPSADNVVLEMMQKTK